MKSYLEPALLDTEAPHAQRGPFFRQRTLARCADWPRRRSTDQKTKFGLTPACPTMPRHMPNYTAVYPGSRLLLSIGVALLICADPRMDVAAATTKTRVSTKAKADDAKAERARKVAAKARARAERARRESSASSREPRITPSSYPKKRESRNETEVWESALPPELYLRVKEFVRTIMPDTSLRDPSTRWGGNGDESENEEEVGGRHNYVPLSREHAPRNAVEEAIGYLASTLVRPPTSQIVHEQNGEWQGVEWWIERRPARPRPYHVTMDSYKVKKSTLIFIVIYHRHRSFIIEHIALISTQARLSRDEPLIY